MTLTDTNILDNIIENIQPIFCNISSENKTGFFNFNINLLSNADLSINFFHIMSSFCFRQSINTPTRLNTDGNFSSLIDRIFSNTYMQLHSGTISYDISDHLPIICTTYRKITNVCANHNKYIKNVTVEKIVSFSKLIYQESWISIYEQGKLEHAYNSFLEIFHSYYKFCFSLSKNAQHLINQGNIGVSQELSSLVTLNVYCIKYLSVILLTYINKIMLYSEIDLMKSSESLSRYNTLIFSMIVLWKRLGLV